MKLTLIAKRTVERNYGFVGTDAIVQHHEFGLLFVCDGFGGGCLEGGCVRWKHGGAYHLVDGDSFEKLSEEFNEHCTIYEAMKAGYDADRQPVEISLKQLESWVKALGI